MNTPKIFIPDESQERVINARQGFHLVLAPPGCGKTQILTERIGKAHAEYGINYDDMLCLTFTNRAARGMMERISENINDADVEKVFVGNIHRYCIRLISSEGLVPSNTAVIDDDDALSILSRFMNIDEQQVASSFDKRKECFNAIHLSQMMHQIKNGYPREIRLHPEALEKGDVTAMKAICMLHDQPFTPETMYDMYVKADVYIDTFKHTQVALPANVTNITNAGDMLKILNKLNLAHNYEKYKKDHELIDFNDILLIAYDALHEASLSNNEEDRALIEKARKPWIQVDEVQDLSPLQMAIVDLITDKSNEKLMVMYLGDEQQSIFSFMGTKASTMNMLRERCGTNIHHLSKNHRSPKYLLDIYNTYAEKVLGIRPDILPQPARINEEMTEAPLCIMQSQSMQDEIKNVALQARQWLGNNDTETSAIIVLTNADAEAVSRQLRELDTDHFKISGTDLFSTPEMKLILAHFAACQSDNNQIAWARIMQGTKAIESAYGARDFVNSMLMLAMSPAELICKNPYSTTSFADCYDNDTIVIFDTETTGLNVFSDDIIQLAATKVRQGEVLGSFMVHIETERTIPAMLGTIVNPIVEERKSSTILSHSEALSRFADFVGDATLLAHNADFDIHILEHNIKRYAPELYDGGNALPRCFDSLRLIRLLEPSLKVYKLKYLLEALHLEGSNSHLADDDVFATKSLVDYCYKKAKAIKDAQMAFLNKESTKNIQVALLRNYAPLYHHTKDLMWKTSADSDVAKEIKYIHDALVRDALIQKIAKIDYAIAYIGEDLINRETFPYMASQLMRYGAEINTLKEADICNSNRIKERIYVTTVHKAKGLEFDNVIVFDAVDGRYPGFKASTIEERAEDARKFYVAMSRAKKRLFISVCQTFISRTGTVFNKKITPFMSCIKGMFSLQ